MKALKKIIMAMFLMACMGMTVSCDKEDDNGNDNNSYSSMLVGTWQVDRLTFDGTDLTQMIGGIQFSFSSDDTGYMNNDGETENNGFTWVIDGDNITITTTHHGDRMPFTIINMTNTECTFTGNTMEMDGQVFDGTIEIHMTKISGDNPTPNPNPNPNPNPQSLEGSEWEFSYSGTMVEEGMEMAFNIAMELNFATATNGTLLMKIEYSIMGQIDSQTQDAPFSYTYDPETHTGTLTATFTDPDSGETETNTIPFSYSSSEDAITISNPNPQSTEGILPDTLVFSRK